jgi:predicted ArsR family transcriptional regulator
MLTPQVLDTTRGRIVTLLQEKPLTVEDIAKAVGLTPNAVRAQLTSMERDRLVRRAGRRAGAPRPSHLFELTAEVEHLLSRAYIPLLTQLVQTFAANLPPDQLEGLLRETGTALGKALVAGRPPSGSLRSRATLASRILNEQLGARTRVVKNGQFVIQGANCPLSALTGKHAGVCLAMESLVSEIVGERVHECCERAGRPNCCFEIEERAYRSGSAGSGRTRPTASQCTGANYRFAVRILSRDPGAMRLVESRFQLLILATVVSNSCAIAKSVSPCFTR